MFWLPQGVTWLNRNKSRPFVLATSCRRNSLGTLVYGSTQETEKRWGAACVHVSPVGRGVNRNGLLADTFFYPGVLLPIDCPDLPSHAGFLGRSVDALRRQLRMALGIGQGSCVNAGAPPGSRRGRILTLRRGLARELQTACAVVLTEQEYSRQRKYHVILPIYAGADEQPDPHDLVIAGRSWLHALPERPQRATLPIPATHSVWYGDDVARETEHVMDDESLARIDRALCDFFSLPAPPPAG